MTDLEKWKKCLSLVDEAGIIVFGRQKFTIKLPDQHLDYDLDLAKAIKEIIDYGNVFGDDVIIVMETIERSRTVAKITPKGLNKSYQVHYSEFIRMLN